MEASRRPYEPPTIVDLGSIADHTYCNPLEKPFKGGGIVYHCDVHNEWSGGTGEDKGNCPKNCDTNRGGLGNDK